MSLPQIYCENQFGEKQTLYVFMAGTTFTGPDVIDGSILANFSGSTGQASAQTTLAVSNKLPAKTTVTAISAQSATTTATVTTAGGNTYSDAAINTALATTNTNINLVVTQLNAILAALKVVA